jgi:hypothetical protein
MDYMNSKKTKFSNHFMFEKKTKDNPMISSARTRLHSKLANTRMNLLYIQVGFAMITFAGIYKKKYILLFGLTILLGACIKYILINNMIDNNDYYNSFLIDYLSLLIVPFGLVVIYLEFYRQEKK